MSESTTAPHPLDDLLTRIRTTANLYACDLGAMPEEMLTFTSSKARTPYDLTSEVVMVNRIAAAGARGESPEVDGRSGWHHAPESYCQKETVIADFNASIGELLTALRTATDENLGRIVDSPLGPIPVIRLANIVPLHIMYHSGQLNYIQTLHGDDELHWK